MQNNITYPHYISTYPDGKDEFINKPHESLANILKEIIVNNKYQLENKLIGLEGEWGSGKTNVIKSLEQNIKNDPNLMGEKYYIFTFDVWSHQEDITRKAFLEQLIIDLKYQKMFKKSDEFWRMKLDQLSAKHIITSMHKFPRIKLFYLFFALLPIIYYTGHPIAKLFHLNSPIYHWIKLSLYVLFGILGSIDLICSGIKIKKLIKLKFKRYDAFKVLYNTIGTLFYIYQGKEITSSQDETIIEDNPSVSRFQNIFFEIINDIKDKNHLVIIFDNMDRLNSKNKLLSVWSSIFTFFSNNDNLKGNNKVWAIVTYDKKHLTSLFEGYDPKKTPDQPQSSSENTNTQDKQEDMLLQEFFSKTFSTSFKVALPIASNWNQYLIDKLTDAFGEKNNDSYNKIALIFQYSYTFDKIRPRQIITFVNDLVSLYIQHQDKNIDKLYFALFLAYKDRINELPLDEITKHISFNKIEFLFPDHDLTTKCLAVLYYNIKIECVDEILIYKSMYSSIQLPKDNTNLQFIKNVCNENSSSLSHVYKYLDDNVINQDFDIVSSYSFFVELMEYLNTNNNKDIVEKYWESFIVNFEKLPYNQSYIIDFYEPVLRSAPINIANKVIVDLLPKALKFNNIDYGLILAACYHISRKDGQLTINNNNVAMPFNDIFNLIGSLKNKKILLLDDNNGDDYIFFKKLKIDISGPRYGNISGQDSVKRFIGEYYRE